MMPISLESFDQKGFHVEKMDILEKMDSLNKHFKSSLKPENGVYGITRIIAENGLTKVFSRNEAGHIRADYFRDDKIFQTREKVSDTKWVRTRYDDNGTAYIKEISESSEGNIKKYTAILQPNVEIRKGNFISITDSLGRPLLNKIEDLQIKETARESMSAASKFFTPGEGFERGHIIADNFGGPASSENLVAQEKGINHGEYLKMENQVRKLKLGNPEAKIDLEVKVNYDSKDSKRASSFEPRVYINGEEDKSFSKEYRKIYNTPDITTPQKMKVNVMEHVEAFKRSAGHRAGLESGMTAATLTCAVSTVENVSHYMDGEISAEEMAIDIVKDSGTAGAAGYAVDFISTTASAAMRESSHVLIKSLGTAGSGCVPAAVVSFGVETFDDVVNFAQGKIDGKELAYNLGESGVGVVGGVAGMAASGAIVGSVVPGAGTVVGFGAGLVGGLVGTALASEGYKTAVELGSSDNAKALAGKAQECVTHTIETAKVYVPEQVDHIRAAIHTFVQENQIPIHL